MLRGVCLTFHPHFVFQDTPGRLLQPPQVRLPGDQASVAAYALRVPSSSFRTISVGEAGPSRPACQLWAGRLLTAVG